MTIRMLQAWNGLHQQKIVTTLSGSDEAALVAAGIATYDLDGPSENLRMAQLATDAGGNVVGVYVQGGQLIKFSKTAAGGPDVAITGATTEQVLAALSLPADFLGANGFIRGTLRFQYTNNANNKVMRVRLGGIAGASLAGMVGTTNGYMTYQFVINNKGAKNSQIGNATDGIWQASSTSVPSTGSADTTQALDVVVTGQLTNAADTLTLRSWYIEAVPME